MGSIWWEEAIAVPAAQAWAALRRVGEAHRLFSPVLTDATMEGDVRTVTFASGMVVRERILSVDETRRRVAYTVLGPMFEHHSASMQIVAVDDASCCFVWITDFLPDGIGSTVEPLVRQGSRALVDNIQRQNV
jgi:hypothetical protein